MFISFCVYIFIEQNIIFICFVTIFDSFMIGEEVWEQCNRVFDRLPLACIIDKEIFCVHGGIPRKTSVEYNELQSVMQVPVVSGVMPAYDYETDEEVVDQITGGGGNCSHSAQSAARCGS